MLLTSINKDIEVQEKVAGSPFFLRQVWRKLARIGFPFATFAQNTYCHLVATEGIAFLARVHRLQSRCPHEASEFSSG